MNQRFCNGMVHVIKEGETLYQLSRMYRIPVALLMLRQSLCRCIQSAAGTGDLHSYVPPFSWYDA